MDYKRKYEKYKQKCELINNKQHGGGNLEEILEKMFEHQTQIKMLHFQTKSYGRHKLLDSYLDKFNDNFDRFMEVAQGATSTVTNKVFDKPIKMFEDSNVLEKLTSFSDDVLNGIVETTFGNHKGLSAIRDEMVADLDQLKYLLRFL